MPVQVTDPDFLKIMLEAVWDVKELNGQNVAPDETDSPSTSMPAVQPAPAAPAAAAAAGHLLDAVVHDDMLFGEAELALEDGEEA